MQDIDEGLAFLQTAEGAPGIAQERADSHPTKQRVQAFKSRVFGLLLLFVEKSKDLSPLLDNLSQDLFLQQPEKMQEMVSRILNRGAVGCEKLQQLAEYYKTFLLFKSTRNGQLFAEGFVRVLRTLHQASAEAAGKLVQEMLELFLTKRKCRLQAGFFHFLLRRLPQLKGALLERCLAVELNQQLRPAQQRVLGKLKQLLLGRQSVKVETQEENRHE